MNVVFYLTASSMGICQYPLHRSSLVKYLVLFIFAMMSSEVFIVSGSNMDTLFNFLYSRHFLKLRSFFWTMTIGEEYGETLRHIIPNFSIS